MGACLLSPSTLLFGPLCWAVQQVQEADRGSWAFQQGVLLLAQVSVVQADNFAWFGYPDDPEPSARSFLPGLAKAGVLAIFRKT